MWFGLLPVRSPLLRESSLFLGVREMFQFPRCPPGPQARCPVSPRTGCPIRRSQDHQFPALPLRISPRGRVLHRPVAPRHPPCAHLWFMTSRSIRPADRIRGARDAACPAARTPGALRWRVQHSLLARCPPAHPGGWSRGDSNPGPPPCKGGALPAKLRPPVPQGSPGYRWARLDSNQGPRPYQGRALTS